MNRIGFTYQRPNELHIWLWVYSRSPFIPAFFRKDLFYKVKKHIGWEISINLNSPKLTLMGRSDREVPLVAKQRGIVQLWVNQSFTEMRLPPRFGKTTLISKLVNSIPTDLSVLILVTCERHAASMRDLISNRPNTDIRIGIVHPDDEYDFVFVDAVDSVFVPQGIAIGKTLVLY